MSDVIKHECGIAHIRLRKPLQYYIDKYKTPFYGTNKMYLLMQKQHNRGQDGAGTACIKIDHPPGQHFIARYRSVADQPIMDIFKKIGKKQKKLRKANLRKFERAQWLKNHVPYYGEVFLGHLRYGTHGKNSIENCHPMIRRSNWKSRNLILAGNFNMTNNDELFDYLVALGQHPADEIDTITVMEKIGHFLDEENQTLFKKLKAEGLSNTEISERISNELDIQNILKRSCKDFDGGYAMVGMIGFGASFVARDPGGIRPAYFYANDEIIAVASEKPAIKTTFGAEYSQIEEIKPGCALIIDKQGQYEQKRFVEASTKTPCSFERIYFSRGSDPEIYQERKKLGELLVPAILKKIGHDLENTVFSYIPNTAETAFLGMVAGLEQYLIKERVRAISKGMEHKELEALLSFKPRVEKLVIKDMTLRTFIADGDARDDLVAHVYDTTYEVIKKKVDTIVVIDDSIVRGTTLEKSIIHILDKLDPKKIVIVSSAPQIRYPDCYGIDMSKMHDFVAFRAMLNLLAKNRLSHLLQEVYDSCVYALKQGTATETNFVKRLYDQFTYEEISDEVARIIKREHIEADLSVIFQSVDNLHLASPEHKGDWYFTGDYPTPGGNKVVNKSFVNFMEGSNARPY